MIAGTGVDLVGLGRFRKLLRRHRNLSRLYGPAEPDFLRRRNESGSYAANFCAKEAFAKALGTGVRGFRLCDVQLLRNEAGRPFFRLSGGAAAAARGRRFHVSVTHADGYAAAFVIAENADEPE